MSDKNRPVVSFCIPVYNNAEAAVKIVQGLLVSDNQDFEVIVSDDASKDNAQELLTQIHDPRFKYYRNEHNLGAHQNWLHSLELGQGEWLYLVMGRDLIHGENISRLIKILKYARDNDIYYLKDGYKWTGKLETNDIEVFSGIDSMINFLLVIHPSGDIFNREIFMSIPDRLFYLENYDMFSENYLRREMLIKGKGAFCASRVYVYTEPRLINFAKVKSGVEHDKNIFDAYYAPKRLIKQHIELINMVEKELPGVFSERELNKYFSAKLKELLNFVSIVWFFRCKDYGWTAHYGHSTRHVTVKETMSNISKACSDITTYLKEAGIYSRSKQKIIYYQAMNALVPAIYLHFKEAVKKILKPIGIWRILRVIRYRSWEKSKSPE